MTVATETLALKLTDRINRIDIYTSTLQDVRRKILRIIEGAVGKPLESQTRVS